jgi:hypothetical protein
MTHVTDAERQLILRLIDAQVMAQIMKHHSDQAAHEELRVLLALRRKLEGVDKRITVS